MSDHVKSLIRACQRDQEGGPGLTPNELAAIMDQLAILASHDALQQHAKERAALYKPTAAETSTDGY